MAEGFGSGCCAGGHVADQIVNFIRNIVESGAAKDAPAIHTHIFG